ncbi:hypothetical protein [Streptomyces sp. AK02-01A]|uniref:hypothetical protein n=1 Tax=Streptomyces sp. AK02-01A TaxID=3028648 RepID=UPI0029BD7C06|nr:hypothetical protein [Streptomyces sp. AK02-01A]MDX3850980.1 hypothetical protein [Streptomyces sp. AK02-01A]
MTEAEEMAMDVHRYYALGNYGGAPKFDVPEGLRAQVVAALKERLPPPRSKILHRIRGKSFPSGEHQKALDAYLKERKRVAEDEILAARLQAEEINAWAKNTDDPRLHVGPPGRQAHEVINTTKSFSTVDERRAVGVLAEEIYTWARATSGTSPKRDHHDDARTPGQRSPGPAFRAQHSAHTGSQVRRRHSH